MSDGLAERLEAAAGIARAAGALALEIAGSGDLGARPKRTALDLVTRADEEAERLIRSRLRSAFPGDAVVGEEHGWSAGADRTHRWAVDPVDGTANFVRGIPHWCVSVGCLRGGSSVVGAIHDPGRDETFTAALGMGAWRNGAPLARAEPADLETSTWAIGLAEDLPGSRGDVWEERVRPRIGRVRAMGSLALDMAWTAAGRFDAAFYECGLEPWDYGAAEAICTEAGLDLIRVAPRPPASGALLAVPPRWRRFALDALGIEPGP